MNRDELFLTVSKGNQEAANFLTVMVSVLHVWDDLIDKDKPVAPQTITNTFIAALVALPRNPFYGRHFDVLNPVLMSAINNWLVANELEFGDDEDDKRIAFISRSSYVDLITTVAFIVGGLDWVKEIGPSIRRFAHSEGWEGYLVNLQAERDARARVLSGE